MIKCGLCGKIKTKQNHWWIMEWNPYTKSTFAHPFEINADRGMENSAEYCGIECLSKAESMVRSGQNPVREIPE